MKKVIMPDEMANIYWQHLKALAIPKVEETLKLIHSYQGQAYWNKVLIHLQAIRKTKVRSLH